MSETTFTWLAFGGAATVWIVWAAATVTRARRQLAGVRLVDCPETGTVAAVTFDRRIALLAAFVDHPPDAHLAACSRWAVRGPCDEACLPQAHVPGSAVSDLVARWAAQRRCALCGGGLVDEPGVGHHIALRSADGVTREWSDVEPTTLPDALRAHEAVCWNCHVAETFRRLHPELVIDR